MPDSDFVDTYVDVQGKNVVAFKSAGYELMKGFLVVVHSSMLEKILHKIIDPAVRI